MIIFISTLQHLGLADRPELLPLDKPGLSVVDLSIVQAGSIPVILGHHAELPLADVLDWTRLAVIIPRYFILLKLIVFTLPGSRTGKMLLGVIEYR